MASLLMSLKQPICISMCVYLWLAVLAVVNTEEILQPRDETVRVNEETSGLHILTSRRVRKSPASDTVEVAALGRPLYPGVLYDARSDSFIRGVKLWDDKLLTEHVSSRPQTRTDLTFSSSDSLSTKCSHLDVSGSLQVSFLGGLLELGGSARYLHDTTSSTRQSRFTMYYSGITRYEELSMNKLGTITYPQVFEQKSATHVVIAVQYGAQAAVVFNRMISEEENFESNEREMQAMLRKLKYNIQGSAALRMTSKEKEFAKRITCTFHGDLHPDHSCATYEDALELFKNLPKMLKENPQNAVPVKVWLYPLHLLNATAARVEREISAGTARDLEGVMEDLADAERTYNELSESRLANTFRDIRERLNLFYQSFRVYKSMLQSAVGRVLPAIRGGQKEEKSLEDILKIHRNSPFRSDQLKLWLNDSKQEISVLTAQINSLKGVNIVAQEDLDVGYSEVVCLTFTSLKYDDPYLSALQKFVKTDRFNPPEGEQHLVSVPTVKKWFRDPAIMFDVNFNTKAFKSFFSALAPKFVLVISAISDPTNPGSSIYLYSNGQLADKQAHLFLKIMAVCSPASAFRNEEWCNSERVQKYIEQNN
ncbi:stonustoxin subunit alpha-like [Danio rerio]|uniref:Stonustoxin subunit alpha-like n=1 Tax=Danio rerio TaxID=7955 RepID=A0A8M1RH48_DANRE|nr:stonustoxin subunit alpha-like [Danio rerio]XP_005171591.1 stonustoxin subunit alpha-like [Danio rerio]|eukprot:XP_002661065.2 stonustoxin subunit alpha-like [Danio rerio]